MLAQRLVSSVSRFSTQQTTRSFFSLTRTSVNMANVQAQVDGKIKSKKVIVYSKTYCPFCTKAKKVFEELLNKGSLSSEDYEVVEIENDSNCDAIQNYMQKITGGRSVPRVFINGKFIGGGDDVVAKHKSGELVKML